MENWQPTIDNIDSTILRISSLTADELCHEEIVNLLKGIEFFSDNMDNITKRSTLLAIQWLNLYMNVYEKISEHKLKEEFTSTLPTAFARITAWLYFADKTDKQCEYYINSILKNLSHLFVTSKQNIRAKIIRRSKQFLTTIWSTCLSFGDYSTQTIAFSLTPIVLNSMTSVRRKAEIKLLKSKFGQDFEHLHNAREFLNKLNNSAVLDTCMLSFKAANVTIGASYVLSQHCQEIWVDVNLYSEVVTLQTFYKSSTDENFKEVYLKLKLKESLFGNKSPMLVLLLDTPILCSDRIEDAIQIEQEDIVTLTMTLENFHALKTNAHKIKKLCKKTLGNIENKSLSSSIAQDEVENSLRSGSSEIDDTSNSSIQNDIFSELCSEPEFNNEIMNCENLENNSNNIRSLRKRTPKKSYAPIENYSDEENICPKVKKKKKLCRKRKIPTRRSEQPIEIDILRSDALQLNEELISTEALALVPSQTTINANSSNTVEAFEPFMSSECWNMDSPLRGMPEETTAEQATRSEHEMGTELSLNFNWYEARNQHFSGNIEFLKQFGEPMEKSFLNEVGVVFMATIKTLFDDCQRLTAEHIEHSRIIPTLNKLIWMFSALNCYAETKEDDSMK